MQRPRPPTPLPKQSASPSGPALPRLTQQGLDGTAALLQPVAWVGGWEEDSCWQATGWGVQPEAHGGEEGLPAGDATHFVLHTLLGCVHGIALPVLNALQGLLHLEGEEERESEALLCSGASPGFSEWLWGIQSPISEASAGHQGPEDHDTAATARLLEREAAEGRDVIIRARKGWCITEEFCLSSNPPPPAQALLHRH